MQPLERFCTPKVEAKYSAMKAGDHLMRLTIVAFSYLDDAVEKVEFTPEFDIPDENPFKREAESLP